MKIYGNSRALERLSDYGKNNRMPHSLLFFGDTGTGKRTLALYTAMMFFCEERRDSPCMRCKNCERIEKHIHPDVIYSDCSSVSAESMRNMLRSTFEMPVEGSLRVYILAEFQLLNRECQNALLTYLEEPSDRIRFILTASNRNGILPTILSRTAVIQTEVLSSEECGKALKDMGYDNAYTLFENFGGNLGMILSAVSDKNRDIYRKISRELIEYVCEKKEYDAIALMQKLPQPKEDKREPVRAVITETADIIHEAFVMSGSKRKTNGERGELSKRLSETYSIVILNRICNAVTDYVRMTADINFNAKITSNAFIASIFEAIAIDDK